jgi:heptosyltransferase II
MKILIIQQKRIGDVLTSTVLFELLKEKYPDSQLDYLIYPNSIAVVKNNPFIDKFVLLTPEIKKSKFQYLSFLLKLRRQKYDIIIDAYGKPSSTIMSWIANGKKRIGFKKSYSKLLATDVVERNLLSFSIATKAIEHRLKLLEPLDIEFQLIKPKIFLTDEEKDNAKTTLENFGIDFNKNLVMISAVGSNESKTYPLKYLAKVLDFIAAKKEITFLFNYLPSQKKEAISIYDYCNPHTKSKIIIDFYEPDLRKFLALTHHCNALIGNEGGATNMAKALNIPTFTIFSPVVPKNDWNMFEDGKHNISVHVNDFKDQITEVSIPQEIEANNYQELYSLFTPELFEKSLSHFINNNLK